MKSLLIMLSVVVGAVLPQIAHAQDYSTPAVSPEVTPEVRAPSPRIMDPNRPGYFQIGAGPSFGLGMGSDQVMYDINLGYNRNFSDRMTGKLFGDLNLGSSSQPARYIDLGAGLDVYLSEVRQSYGIPYVTGDLGYGFVRNAVDRTQDAASIGAGAGFKFAAEALNFDVNVHYEVLTAQLDNTTPSVFGVRAAMNF
jgi:hypothetical protein